MVHACQYEHLDSFEAFAHAYADQYVDNIEDFAAGKVADDSAEGIRAILRRPIRAPSEFEPRP